MPYHLHLPSKIAKQELINKSFCKASNTSNLIIKAYYKTYETGAQSQNNTTRKYRMDQWNIDFRLLYGVRWAPQLVQAVLAAGVIPSLSVAGAEWYLATACYNDVCQQHGILRGSDSFMDEIYLLLPFILRIHMAQITNLLNYYKKI
jgi:hypothetical protein